jgi:hypothetical protein
MILVAHGHQEIYQQGIHIPQGFIQLKHLLDE